MNKIILTLLLVLIFTTPIYAIDGHVSLNYNLMDKGGIGEIYLYQSFADLTIGGKFKTNLMGFNLKGGFIPAGVPSSQTYDLIINYKISNNIELNFIEGCKHIFSQSNKNYTYDESYIKIGAKYNF